MIKIPADCCGCNACIQICPKNCLSTHVATNGFNYPCIERPDQCIECGLCEKVCPVLHPSAPRHPKYTLAARSRDRETRMASSSGGLFCLLAEKVLEEKGIVFGASFSDTWEVRHTGIEDRNNLHRILRSKYIQSDTGCTYKTVENELRNGRLVLYAGTHCQIAGLKHFLRKDYSRLITVDIVCHGVPSPEVWNKFLKEYKTKHHVKEIKDINFRDKTSGWRRYSFTIKYTNRKNHLQTHSVIYNKNMYMNGFLKNLYLRTSCHNCPAKKGKSACDIMIGDYWNIKRVTPEWDDNLGTSALLIYTEKGKQWCDKLDLDIRHIAYEEATASNSGFQEKIIPHPNRSYFFEHLKQKKSIEKLIKKCIKPNLIEKTILKHIQKKIHKTMNIGIYTLPLHTNYGGILQAYALNKTLQSMGYNVYMLSKCNPPTLPAWKAPFTYALRKFKIWKGKKNIILYKERNKQIISQYTQVFIDTHIKNQIGNKGISRQKIKHLDAIIVGSDQIWRPRFARPIEHAFLDFTGNRRMLRIAYAASFGTDEWEYSTKQTAKCSRLIQKFNAVSVREHEGINLCKKYLKTEAIQVLDPTCLLTKEDYISLIPEEKESRESGNIMLYILDQTTEKQQCIEQIASYIGLNTYSANAETENHNLPASQRIQPPVENWLKSFQHAAFVITDSFHACVFSILFNKPFLVFGNQMRGISRIASLLKLLNLEDRIVLSAENLKEKASAPICWDEVNRKLETEREKAKNFLREALKTSL